MAISTKAQDTHQDIIDIGRQPINGQSPDNLPFDQHRDPSWAAPSGHTCRNVDALNDLFELLHFRFEPEDAVLRCSHGDRQHPCYTPALLSELLRFFATVKRSWTTVGETAFPFRYLVWETDTPGIWNLGGDLTLFTRLIGSGDVEALRDYAYACVNTVYGNFTKGDLPYLSIALVQGDALGGGFEAVLSNDIIIAEEHCLFGLPEIMFSMFPGMGAYSFLSRRLNASAAREMILSGKLFTAQELHNKGLIDLVVPTGTGHAGLRSFLDRNRRRHRALVSMSRVSRRCGGIDHAEFIDVADIWVDNAMGVSATDLRRMERLTRAQRRRYAAADAR